MPLALDHMVVVVDRLEAAAAEFGAAGFTVTPGGRHDGLPTENALVVFADGTYLELLAMRTPADREGLREIRGTAKWEAHLAGVSAIARRFLPRLAGPAGVGDFCASRAPLARFAREARARGVVAAGPVAMERRRPDGVVLAWELLLPADDTLPFFIADRTPRADRVPASPAATTHANGARGITQVTVRAPGVPAAALAWAGLFDLAPRALADGGAALEPGRWRLRLVPGELAGACAVAIAGVATLPESLTSLGVLPEA